MRTTISKNVLSLMLVTVVLLAGCVGQPQTSQLQIPNVKITDASFSSGSITNGQSTTLYVKATNKGSQAVGPVVLEVVLKNTDVPYLKIDQASKDLGTLGIGEDTGERGFNIMGSLQAGVSTKYDITVEVLVNGTVTDSKDVTLTVNQ